VAGLNNKIRTDGLSTPKGSTKRIGRRQHDHDGPRRGRVASGTTSEGAIGAEPDVNSRQTIAIMRQCDLSECCGACSWSVVWDRCAPTHCIGRQKQQSNDQPAPARQQRRSARGQPPKISQTAARHGGWTKQQPHRMRHAAAGGSPEQARGECLRVAVPAR
jgi:hypothetical protein